MKKNNTGWVVIAILLIAAFLLNPKKEKHVAKIIPESPLIPRAGAMAIIKYHNYYLFSTTTDVLTNERQTFGIFGIVFR